MHFFVSNATQSIPIKFNYLKSIAVQFENVPLFIFYNTSLKGGENMGYNGGNGSGFALIVVLFILLIIIGASYAGGGY